MQVSVLVKVSANRTRSPPRSRFDNRTADLEQNPITEGIEPGNGTRKGMDRETRTGRELQRNRIRHTNATRAGA